MNLFIAGVGNVELFKGKNEDKIKVERGSELLNADFARLPEGTILTKLVIKEPEGNSDINAWDDGYLCDINGLPYPEDIFSDWTKLMTLSLSTDFRNGYNIVIDFENKEAYYQDKLTLKKNENYLFDFVKYETIKDRVGAILHVMDFEFYWKKVTVLESKRQSVLVSKTLVDSSINLSVSLEDIRAGAGAKLYGKYAHTSTMTMKLTDAMFRMEFLAANIGSDILQGGSAVATVGKATGAQGAVDISDIDPQPLYEGAKKVVWIAKKGTEDYTVYDADVEKEEQIYEKTIVLSERLSYGAYELPEDCIGLKSATVTWNENLTGADNAYLLLFDESMSEHPDRNEAIAEFEYFYDNVLTQEISFKGFESRSDVKYIYAYNDVAETGLVSFTYYAKNADIKTRNIKTSFSEGEEVCVRYIKSNEAGEHLKVSANFIPDTMTAVLTAPLFAGDENNLESSTKVGTLTITIPRFMLNGTTDLSMTMTGATQMTLEGSALAVNDADCENNDGYYAIIDKVINGQNYLSGLVNIYPYLTYLGPGSKEGYTSEGYTEFYMYDLKIFGTYEDGSKRIIDRKHFNFYDFSGYGACHWLDDGTVMTTAVESSYSSIGGGWIIELLDENGNKIEPLTSIKFGDYPCFVDAGYEPEQEMEGISKYFCVSSSDTL